MTDLKQQLGELGRDLMTRQVNLIIATGGMTAEPMPQDPVVAMRDVYLWYHDRLATPSAESATEIGLMSVQSLAEGFRQLAVDLEPHVQAAQRALVGVGPAAQFPVSNRLACRMQANSFALAEIAEHLATGAEITARERALLLKAWEIGTDEVVLQSTIALDGDVVLRADSRYVTDEQRPLFDLHDQSCAAAMRTWKDIVGAAIDLLTGLFKKAGTST